MSHVCSQCQPAKHYGSSDALRRHKRTHHSDLKSSWQCLKCSKPPFSRKEYLTRHDKEKHTGADLRECELCLRTFSNRYLNEHKKTCKSRFFGQAKEPPPKRARIAELQWKHLALPSHPLRTFDETVLRGSEQASKLKIVRGSVAHKPRQGNITSWDRNGVVTASSSSTRQQELVGNVLEPSKPYCPPEVRICLAIRADDIAMLMRIGGEHVDPQRTLLALKDIWGNESGCYSLLHCAASLGSVQVAQMLLSTGFHVNETNRDGRTPLHEAAIRTNVEMVELLLQRGANINAKDHIGRTALLWMCEHGDCELRQMSALKIIDVLLEGGANIDAEASWNVTALCASTRAGMRLVAKRLLDAGASVNGSSKEGSLTPLMGACFRSAPAIVHMLLEYGADANRCRSRLERQDELDLHMRELFEWEAAINSDMLQPRWTALTYACASTGASEEMSACLLAAGADPNLGDVVPLETAIMYGCSNVINMLLEKGADPSRVSEECIKTLQGLHKLEGLCKAYKELYQERREKWALLQQYHPAMFGDKKCLDSDSESEVNEDEEDNDSDEDHDENDENDQTDERTDNNENDWQDGNDRNDEAVTIDLTMVEDDSSSFYEESDEEQVHEKTAL